MAKGAIKGLTIEIDGNTTKLVEAIKEPVNKSKDLRDALKNVESALKMNPGNMDLIKQKQDLLKQSIGATEDELKALRDAQQRYIDSGQNLNSAGYTELEKRIETVTKTLENLKKEQEEYNSVLDKVAEGAQKFGEGAEVAGRKLMPITAGIGALGTVAVKTTADFDSAMAQVQAVSGASAEEMERLREKARQMGATTKFSASEAADAMNYMGMAGWKAGQMIDGIDGIMNLAAASGEELGTTSDIVTDALTAFGMKAEQSGELADVLAAASSNANTNVSMMGESFKYAASVAGAMNYTCQDTAVALGLMANSGIKASQAGTALRSIITRMAKPTKESGTAMNILGLSIDDSEGHMKSLREVMDDIRAGFGDLSIDMDAFTAGVQELDDQLFNGEITQKEYDAELETLADLAFKATGGLKAQYAAMLAGKNAMSGLLAIVGSSDEDYQKLCDAVDSASESIEYNGEVYEGVSAKMAAVMNDNLTGQLTLLKSALEELAISFGDLMMPKIREGVEKIQDLVDWLNSLDDSTKEMVIQTGAVVAAAGPLLVGIGKVSQGLSSVIGFVQKARNCFGVLTDSTSTLGGTIGAIPGAIGPATVAIGAVAAAAGAACLAINVHIDDIEKELEYMDAERQVYAEMIDAAEEYRESAAKHQEKADEAVGNYESQAKKAEILTEKLGDLIEKEGLNNVEMQIAKDLVDQLNEIYPDLGWKFDDNTGKVQFNTGEIANNTQALKDNMKAVQETARQKAYATAIEEQTAALVDNEIAYADATESLDYFNQKIIDGTKRQQELADAGKQNSDEYKLLSEDIVAAQKKFNEASQALNGCADELTESHEKLLLLQNQVETGGLEYIGQGMIDSLTSLEQTAERTGIRVPAGLREGMEKGTIDVREAAETMANLETLNTMVDDAGKIGGQIPAEMATKMLESSPTLSEANRQLNALINMAEGLEKSRIAGEEIPEVLAKCLADGSISVNEKMQALNEYVAIGSTAMAEDLTKGAQDGVDGAEKAIQDSTIPEDAGKKMDDATNEADEKLKISEVTSNEVKESEDAVDKSEFVEKVRVTAENAQQYWAYNLDKIGPSSVEAVGEAAAAIIQSDADQRAAEKSASITNAFGFSGLGREANNAANEINNAMASVKTDYEIRFEISTMGGTGAAGTAQTFHADGGIFTRPTVIPSIAGNAHIFAEAGAEAILPLEKLSPMLESAVAKTLTAFEQRADPVQRTCEINYERLANAVIEGVSQLKIENNFAVGSKIITREIVPMIDKGLAKIQKRR